MFNILNFRLRHHVLQPSCVLISGDRGAGKSSLFALIAQEALKNGIKVFTQYPYKDCCLIPMSEKIVSGVKRFDVDKEFLYTADFSNSVILLDEVKTIWHARGFNKWTNEDEEFFNFIRKFNTQVYMATQQYDCVDLNVRRSCDETWLLTKNSFLPGLTTVEMSRSSVVKVADKNTEVLGKAFKRGMRKVSYEICEVPIGTFTFYRKPYYKLYDTYFTQQEKQEFNPVYWNDVYFNNKELLTDE